MSIFELTENLILVLTKLDTEHGLAQPQLVSFFFQNVTYVKYILIYLVTKLKYLNILSYHEKLPHIQFPCCNLVNLDEKKIQTRAELR